MSDQQSELARLMERVEAIREEHEHSAVEHCDHVDLLAAVDALRDLVGRMAEGLRPLSQNVKSVALGDSDRKFVRALLAEAGGRGEGEEI